MKIDSGKFLPQHGILIGSAVGSTCMQTICDEPSLSSSKTVIKTSRQDALFCRLLHLKQRWIGSAIPVLVSHLDSMTAHQTT